MLELRNETLNRLQNQKQSKRKVLVIEDDTEYRAYLVNVLKDEFEVLVAADAKSAFLTALRVHPDLMIVDAGLPDENGILLCDRFRKDERLAEVMLVILTATDGDEIRTCAYEMGVDDFITKPVSATELKARVKSKLRRVASFEDKNLELQCGNLSIDPKAHLVTLSLDSVKQQIELTSIEFDLLKHFMRNQDVVLDRLDVLKAVWKSTIVSERTIDHHVVSLRRALKGFDHEIVTVYGIGYVLKKNTAL